MTTIMITVLMKKKGINGVLERRQQNISRIKSLKDWKLLPTYSIKDLV